MKTVCIKIGGAIIDAEGILLEIGKSVVGLMPEVFPVIIHGGGKDISRFLDLLNREVVFVEGMRVTDAETVAIVQMVLSGDVNKRIVNAFLKEGLRSLGMSGVDDNLFQASKMFMRGKDIGFVGKIDRVNTQVIEMCRQNGIVPVVSPISRDAEGNVFNVNADLAASELAMALKADDLIFVSDVAGVLIEKVFRPEIRISEIEGLIAAGQVTGGMIPKLRSAADAVRCGVGRVHICGWKDGATLERQLSCDATTGTVIRA